MIIGLKEVEGVIVALPDGGGWPVVYGQKKEKL